ncbi:MAG: hypothetical protein AB7D43_09775 [Sulfurimonadaceae bacterium]
MYNEAEVIINKIMEKLNLKSYKELAELMGLSAAAISRWKKYNYVDPIKKKCRELGIYDEIFGVTDTQINNFQNSTNVVGQDFSSNNAGSRAQTIQTTSHNIDSNTLKLFDTLYSFASSKQKIDELKTDLSSLLQKYM